MTTGIKAFFNRFSAVVVIFAKDHFMIDYVMVSVFALSAVDRGFELRSGQTKDAKIDICCFSAKNLELRRKSKDWLARNQDNVSEWGDISICTQCVSVS